MIWPRRLAVDGVAAVSLVLVVAGLFAGIGMSRLEDPSQVTQTQVYFRSMGLREIGLAGRIARREGDVLYVRDRSQRLREVWLVENTTISRKRQRLDRSALTPGLSVVVVGRTVRDRALEARLVYVWAVSAIGPDSSNPQRPGAVELLEFSVPTPER